jgi:hypothetical protein
MASCRDVRSRHASGRKKNSLRKRNARDRLLLRPFLTSQRNQSPVLHPRRNNLQLKRHSLLKVRKRRVKRRNLKLIRTMNTRTSTLKRR